MAHVKWNMACGCVITNAENGEATFFPLESLEVDETLYNQILEDPASVTGIEVRFKWDENNQSVRAYLYRP